MLRNQSGFTLIELIIAMVVFSFLLAIVTVGFITLARTQQRGLAERNTQQNARRALEEIVRTVREGDDLTTTDCSASGVDLWQIRVHLPSGWVTFYVSGGALSRTNNAMPTCTLGPDVRLTAGDVQVTRLKANLFKQTGKNPSVQFEITVTSPNASLNPAKTSCLPAPGSQYCAATTLKTTAGVRGA